MKKNIATPVETINADSINTMLDKFGLAWTVSKERLLLSDGTETPFFGIVRNDTRKTFQTCKAGYEVFQNDALAEIVHRIADKTGYKLHNGGSLNGGAKVYMQLETGIAKGIGENNDKIVKYVTALNSHDGSTSLRWGHTNLTISCQNTFHAAYNRMESRARHTKSIHQIVEQSLREIEKVRTSEAEVIQTIKEMAEKKVTKGMIADVVSMAIDVDMLLTKKQLEEEYSTYKLDQLSLLLASIDSEMKQKGSTQWGLFSGVTQFTTHKLKVSERENARIESKFMGEAFRIDNDAFMVLG